MKLIGGVSFVFCYYRLFWEYLKLKIEKATKKFKTGIKKRASDIHIEPLENELRVNKFSRRHILCAWNPAQVKDSKCRTTIFGYPILVFH